MKLEAQSVCSEGWSALYEQGEALLSVQDTVDVFTRLYSTSIKLKLRLGRYVQVTMF